MESDFSLSTHHLHVHAGTHGQTSFLYMLLFSVFDIGFFERMLHPKILF